MFLSVSYSFLRFQVCVLRLSYYFITSSLCFVSDCYCVGLYTLLSAEFLNGGRGEVQVNPSDDNYHSPFISSIYLSLSL